MRIANGQQQMLIDATHPEETRVVVLRGNRVEEFDFESAHRKQLRGNIYLAKVTRVEPSLQAAFVDYGGNRHGFLAFSEIHPDYYQIPVADRQALIAEEERAQRAADDEADRVPRPQPTQRRFRAVAPKRSAARLAKRGSTRSKRTSRMPPPIGMPTSTPMRCRAAKRRVRRRGHCIARRNAARMPQRRNIRHRASSMPDFGNGSRGRRSADEVERRARRARRRGVPAETASDELAEAASTAGRDTAKARLPQRRRRGLMPMATAKKQPKRKSSNRSAAPTRWKRCPIARRAIAASTRSRKSSSAGRSCWCRWSRKSAAPRARR